MTHLNSTKVPLLSIGGFLVIFTFSVFTLTSLTLYRGLYSPFNNWLSDLGNLDKNPVGYIYFNYGCVLTGFAIILSVIGISKWKTTDRKQNNLILLSQYCGFLAALSLIMVGIFSENYSTHDLWAVIFFVLLLLFMIIINIALNTHIKYLKWIKHYAVVSIAVNFAFAYTDIIGPDIPILEWMAVFTGLIWIALIGYNTLKLKNDVNNLNANTI
jgi:hypothetical membrane protein